MSEGTVLPCIPCHCNDFALLWHNGVSSGYERSAHWCNSTISICAALIFVHLSKCISNDIDILCVFFIGNDGYLYSLIARLTDLSFLYMKFTSIVKFNST